MRSNYANLPIRIKAVVIDAIIIVAAMFVVSEALSFFENVPDFLRASIGVCIFILYEPLLVSLKGGTIGQSFMNISVRQERDETKRINIASAFLRFFLKVVLGWFSMLGVTSNEKRKAIHDSAASSVVLDLNN